MSQKVPAGARVHTIDKGARIVISCKDPEGTLIPCIAWDLDAMATVVVLSDSQYQAIRHHLLHVVSTSK